LGGVVLVAVAFFWPVTLGCRFLLFVDLVALAPVR
jgi:hypothetical protein